MPTPEPTDVTPGADYGAEAFRDELEDCIAESMKDPEYATLARAADERQARLVESLCSEGNCVVLTDPDDPEYEGGWGPVDCPCQDDHTTPLPSGSDQGATS